MPDLAVFSIVIVSYRSRDELPPCLGVPPAELLGRPVEVCVVDNSPNDGVGAWIAGAFCAVPLVQPGQNLGFGLANNPGYRATTSERVMFLNPDTISYGVGAINGAFMLGPREVFEKVGPFDESFFKYGDDLDLCIRVARAGYRLVRAGGGPITHLKGLSVAMDFDRMFTAICDVNGDVYLKHFGAPAIARAKWRLMNGCRRRFSLLSTKWRGHRAMRPV
jgi:GT2 family glycosyltransferase